MRWRRRSEARSELHRLALALAAVLCTSAAEAQPSPYRAIKVRSCPSADSLLGPLRDDYRGVVRGFYHKERDTTYLVSGAGKPRVSISIKFAGHGPTRDPEAQVAAFFRGGEASLVEATRDSLAVTLVLDDSATIQPAAVAMGTFVGPKEMIVIPVSALLPIDDLVKAARARQIRFDARVVSKPFAQSDRQELRAILRVAVCPP